MISPLILASTSPRRRELLASNGFEFKVVGSSAEELHDSSLPVEKLCELNAAQKALAVAKQFPGALVIGADTLVAMQNQLFGKPADLNEARRTLAGLSGLTHQVVTGVALMRLENKFEKVFSVTTQVTFKKLDAGTIERYLELVPVLDKAGSYAIQEHGELIVERINGSLSNVIGLPMERLSAELTALGLPGRTGRNQ